MSALTGRVILEIDLGGRHADVPSPAVGRWSKVRTPAGWRLEAKLSSRDFLTLAAALRIRPANARRLPRDRMAHLSLRPVAWPGAAAVTLRFDATLLGWPTDPLAED